MNATAAAPTRPKNTHKPAKNGEAAMATPPVQAQVGAQTEYQEALQQALNILMHVSTDLSEANLSSIPGALEVAIKASDIACQMCNPQDYEIEPFAPLDGLTLMCHHLDSLALCLEGAIDTSLPAAISASCLLDCTDQFARSLYSAIASGSLEELRALTTYAGAKPCRDRPRPPIRRAPAETEGGVFTKAQLQMFLEQVAGQAATLNDVLMMAQSSQEEWERDRLVNAAQVMAQGLGCLADHAAGEQILGGMGRWHCGPDFTRTGGAA